MLLLLSSLAHLWLKAIRAFILSFYLEEKKVPEHEGRATEQLAEINGGTWEPMSVFEHIELGLKKDPAGLAVICTFQPANHLESLVPREEKFPQPNAIQAENGVNGPHQQSDPSEFHNNCHHNVIPWDNQQNQLTHSVKQEKISKTPSPARHV